MDHNQLLQAAPTSYPFTDGELARLAAYRAAVKAGFYTDTPSEPPTFTPRELGRVATYRAAIKAGFYTDFLDEGDDSEARTASDQVKRLELNARPFLKKRNEKQP